MSFFRRKKEEPQIPAPSSGGYGSSPSYAADDYGADEYSSSAYGRSGGLQPGPTTGRGRSVSPSGYGSQPYGGRSRYDTPDDPSEYSYTSTAVSSRSNVLQKGKPANRGAPAREDADYGDTYNDTATYKSKSTVVSREDPVVDAKKRDLLFAGATVKPAARPANARSPSNYENQGSEDEFEDEEAILQATDKTRDETRRVLDDTIAAGRQVLDTAVGINRRLAEQGEQLGATERHLIAADGHANRAGDNLDDVKVLNRSIFIPAWTRDKSARRQAEEEKQQRRYEKSRRDLDQNSAFVRSQQTALASSRDGPPDDDDDNDRLKASRNARGGKYAHLDDATAEKERAIDDGLDVLQGMLGKIRLQAEGMGAQTDAHLKQLRNTERRTDELDQNISVQRNKMDRLTRR